MLKLVGSIFIILAATLCGYSLAKRLSDRTEQIRNLLMCLQLLETEISYGATPLQKAFQKIGQQHVGVIGQLFQRCAKNFVELDGATTAQCWNEALIYMKPSSAFKQVEWEWLEHFGAVIGGSDRQDQQKHLHLMMAHLKKCEGEAREDQRKYENMYRTLGFLSGAVIVILLM